MEDGYIQIESHITREPQMSSSKKSVGLALGGGGARGIVHILVLEVLDEFDIKPKMISGASIGAILGALYASGHSGKVIRDYVDRHIKISGDTRNWKEDGRKMMEMVRLLDIDFRGTGLIKGERFSHFLYEMLDLDNFDDLKIPLKVVATNYWESSQVVFQDGPLLPAIKASMSVPGVFSPVVYQNQVLVDGACVNPVPWDILEDCEFIIGVNALGRAARPESPKPPIAAKTVLETFEILQRSILAEKYRYDPPDILIDPPIRGIGILDFHKAKSVYDQCEGVQDQLRQFLTEHLLSK